MSRLSTTQSTHQSVQLAQALIIDVLKPVPTALRILEDAITTIQLAASIFDTFQVANEGVDSEAAIQKLQKIAADIDSEASFVMGGDLKERLRHLTTAINDLVDELYNAKSN